MRWIRIGSAIIPPISPVQTAGELVNRLSNMILIRDGGEGDLLPQGTNNLNDEAVFFERITRSSFECLNDFTQIVALVV